MTQAIDLLKIEIALYNELPTINLNAQEIEIYNREKPMFDVGRMAEISAQAYYSHAAAIIAARDPRAKELLNSVQENQPIPTEMVMRKNGTGHIFDSHYYLDRLSQPEIYNEFSAIWLVGSLLKVGDALSSQEYFDHGPDVELLYHLRNGIAHGNRFNINERGIKRLAKWPAHNRNCLIKMPDSEFQVKPELNGMPVLFEFMGPGDILDLLQSIAVRFMRLRERLV